MSKLEQVLDAFEDAAVAVDGDVAHARSRGTVVEVDGADALFGQSRAHSGIYLRGEEGSAGHLQTDQPLERAARALRILICVHHDGFHARETGGILKRLADLGKKGVANIGYDQTNERASTERQARAAVFQA